MAAPIPLNRDFQPRFGVVEQVAPGLRRVTARNGGPFTFHGTGTYIVGEGRVAVIDPGPDRADHVAALLAALAGETVTHILVTHTHNDHSPACRPLQAATGAPCWGYGPHGGDRRRQGIAVEEGGDMDFVPDHAVRHGDVIAGDGWSMECVHTPGHTSNHLCFAWRERAGLFSGDHVMGWSTSVISPPDGDMADYMRSLDLLLARDDRIYWPTHGPPIADPKPLVRAFIAHRRAREDKVLAALRHGPATVAEMVPLVYADTPAHLHAAAARSLLATVLLLRGEGRIAGGAEGGDAAAALAARYRLV